MLRFRIARLAVVIAFGVLLSCVSAVDAGNDTWKLGLNANWENGGAWTDGTTPGNGDTASLGFASTYTATFGVAPAAIQNLTVTGGGNLTFASSGGTKTLNVNAAGGAQDLNLGTGSTLNLGTAGNAFNLVLGADITNLSGSTLNVTNASHMTAVDLSPSGLAGQIVVNGAGSLLTLTGNGEHYVGGSAGFGSIILQNTTASANITGILGVGDAAVVSSGNVSLTGNSTMSLSSDLKLASQNVIGSSGSFSVAGATTSFTQSGSGTVYVGSFNNGTASLNVGGSTSATMTTGTGGLVVRPTGSMTVGGGGTVGILNVNGDLYVQGGGAGTGLTIASGSTFTHAAGKYVFV